MTSLVLRNGSRFLTVLLAVFALFMLLRGHNEPGGGFIGGLMMATAFSLYLLTFGLAAARRLIRFDPMTLTAGGLAASLLSGAVALVRGQPFLTSQWTQMEIPGIGKIGTVLLFDIGVFLIVFGTTMQIVFSLAAYRDPDEVDPATEESPDMEGGDR
jgi:multicomponent Na+:H+ antiporter subunit B